MNCKLLVITLALMSGFVGSAFAQNLVQQNELSPEDVMNEIRDKGVIIRTQEGSFMIQLFPEDAPNHVYHFLKLIESGYYEGTIFHRIISNFMIQAGDPNTKDPELDRTTWGTGGPGYNIKNEFNTIKHDRGIVSMARGSSPDSAGSQFFIVVKDSNSLDGQYTAFGRILPGTFSFKNLDRIAGLDTDAKNAPEDPFRATILETQVITYFPPDFLLPPDRLDSVDRPIKTGGGVLIQHINDKYGVVFDLPYRWEANSISDNVFRLEIKPGELNHNALSAAEKSGFIPQIFVSAEKRTSEMLSPDFVIDPNSFFSIRGGEEPEFLSNNLFENEDGRFAHLITSTQVVQTSTETVKFKIIQIHFTNLETNYSVIYVNTVEYFRSEINAFEQTVKNFKISFDGKRQLINFADNDIFKQVIRDGREAPIPEPEPPLRVGGCLIATASYGSELAPQVQQLRELRDNTVLQTKSGSIFMTGFNQFYYSFSPTIADYERANPAFKEAVKLTITPLLTSLALLQHTSIDSESEMLGYGIAIILLNIGMYFVAPAVLIMKIRSFYKLQ